MKIIYLFIFFSFTLFSYKIPIDNFKIEYPEKFITSDKGKKFFDYDEIDRFHLSNTENNNEFRLDVLYSKSSPSKFDSLKRGVISLYTPTDVPDLNFIKLLEKIGYKRSVIDKSKFASINKIFAEKSVKEKYETGCRNVYRDIFLFKKSNKIIGTAKICFSCGAHQIKGTKRNTDNFGQDGDYEKLENLLRR